MITEENAQRVKSKLNELSKEMRLSLIREGKPIRLAAWGRSMRPFIKNGDDVEISPLAADDARIGDILAVTGKSEDRTWFCFHRLVNIEERGGVKTYLTKGDGNRSCDLAITARQIAGRVTKIRRGDLEIDLNRRLWVHLNGLIAGLSSAYPGLLILLSRYINMAIEWKSIPSRLKNKLRKGGTIRYNAEELLLICVRKDLSEALKNYAVGLIKEGVDWEFFYESAAGEGLPVTVCGNIAEIRSLALIPQWVADKLKNARFLVLSKTLRRHKETEELLRLFSEEKVPAIALKGSLLSERIYNDPAARGYGVDCDLLIKEEDRERASELLKSVGYKEAPDIEPGRWRCKYAFRSPGAILVDLHVDITMFYRTRERIEGLWKGAMLTEKGGAAYYELKEEELLIFLSAHIVSSNALKSLKHIRDIHELLFRYGAVLDWDSVIEKARRWKLISSLYAALTASQKLFASDAADNVLNKIRPSFAKRAFIGFFANRKFVLRDCKRKRFMDTFLSYVFFELVEARNLKEYAYIIWSRILFPPKDVLLSNANYSSKPIYLGYLARLKNGFLELSRKVIP